MCYRPLHMRTRATALDLQGGQQYYVDVPCGKCAECQKANKNQYYLRSYYEALSCMESGGFVYFDTLTYRNSDLPHLSEILPDLKGTSKDFPRFNYHHVRKFFALLRVRLSRQYGIDKDAFKYFLTSEYGTSPTATHRPHYHCLFYVRGSISALDFSKLVSECWPYGRTDGLPYQPALYVLNHTCQGSTVDHVRLESYCNYVAKYVVKSSKFDKQIASRIASSLNFLKAYKQHFTCVAVDGTPVDMSFDVPVSQLKVLRRRLYSHCAQFHRQSIGFGFDALKYNDYNEIFKTGMMSVPTSKDIVLHIPLPLYFKRKLFYNLVKDYRNLPVWELNTEGERYLLSRLQDSCDQFATRCSSWYIGLPSEQSDYVDSLLNGRTFDDFAEYCLIYRGRVASPDMVNSRLFYGESSFDGLDEWLINVYRTKHISRIPNSENPLPSIKRHCPIYKNLPIYTFDDFKNGFIITEASHPNFKDYDKLFAFYSESLRTKNIVKQDLHDFLQILEDRHKSYRNCINPNPFNSLINEKVTFTA